MTPLPSYLHFVQVFLGPVATLIAAIMAAYFVRAQRRIQELKAENAALRTRIATLEAKSKQQ